MTIVSGRRKGKGIIFAFLAPALLLYAFFFLYPTFEALRMSLYDWSGLNIATAEFVGLGNFVEAVGDRWVGIALKNNLWITLYGGVLTIALALLFAVALTTRAFRGKGLFRTIIFFPYMISGVGVGLFWIFVFNPQFGLLNGLLGTLGLEALQRPWLGDPATALACIIFVTVWWGIGFYMLYLVAGIETVPAELLDAARVDGANERQAITHVTLPLLREFLSVAIVLWIIDALRTFGTVLMLTGGGPGNRTTVLATYMAKLAFNIPLGGAGAVFRFGYGTAIAVIMCVLVLLASGLYFWLRRREALEF
jgi:ABC-type sugar transport system permease subunit